MNKDSVKTDEQLVFEYVNGNNSSFDELLQRYNTKIFSYIFSVVNDRNQAEDLLQEIFYKVIVGLKEGKYTNLGCFKYWIMRITRNILIDYFRKNRILFSEPNKDNDLCMLYEESLTDKSHETQMIDVQLRADAVKLMNRLPERQREVVYMKFFEDKSFKEIAEQTKVSINTSLGRMHSAIINMRRMAKKYDILSI